MANRRFQRVQSLEKEIKSLHLKISTDGSADVSSVEGLGVESVSHAANVYTITLEDKYSQFRGLSVISGVSASFQLNSESVSSTKVIELEASAAQLSTDIHVVLHLKNTDVR